MTTPQLHWQTNQIGNELKMSDSRFEFFHKKIITWVAHKILLRNPTLSDCQLKAETLHQLSKIELKESKLGK
ncbi:hypothetical protein [Leuconostoc pseudomesenteroides]|uniref:hypothetical protein n=1 Tax=Leuconostoc pseudomesenteroides TaxID=33968 RepID=UPI0039E9E55B